MMVLNSLTALVTPLMYHAIKAVYPNASPLTTAILTAAGIANTICAIALFRWKRWGWFGFAVTSLIVLIVNVSIGVDFVHCLLGIVGVVVLYCLLELGGNNSAWNRLR